MPDSDVWQKIQKLELASVKSKMRENHGWWWNGR